MFSGCSGDDIGFQSLKRPPAVTINSPEDGSAASEADAIDFVGMVADADGLDDIVTLEWASDVDGVLSTIDDHPADSDGITQFAASLSAGVHAISLTAIDSSELQAVASVSITIGLADYLPVAEISVPANFARYEPGEPIQLVGAASDPNQPPEELSAIWQVSPESGTPRTTIATMTPSTAGSLIGLWEGAEIGIHHIYLVVEDAEGNTKEASVAIEVFDPNADDGDLDGFPAGNDCNDNDNQMFPGNPERCDLKDNDCNGVVDDKDLDNDDHIDNNCVEYPEDLPIDDCDDENGTVFPGAAEQADGLDNDCDGEIDDGLSNFDNDGDCFCTASTCIGSINEDCLAILATGDCDDTNAALHARDDDLDGATPCEGDCDDLDPLLNIDDVDGDNFSTCQDDCNDNDPLFSPADIDVDGASACDGDCNDQDPFYTILDTDADGASTCQGDCNDSSAILNILDEDTDTFTTCEGDCDDTNSFFIPVDTDADGASTCAGDCDDTNPLLNTRDDDADTFSTCQNDCDDTDDTLTPADIDVDGFSTCQNDCDDLVASLNPADLDGDLASTCEGDCDDNNLALNITDADADGGTTCEGDCNDSNTSLNITDADADGFSTCQNDCNDNNPSRDPEDADGDGWSTCDLDCNDVNASVHPTAVEIPYNSIDDDCVGGDLRDVDGDGYNARTVGGTDCNDTNPLINPNASERCNGVDDDCDSTVDEINAIGCSNWYYDGDNDGYGTGTPRCQCGASAATGYDVTNFTDCYDLNTNAHPGQTTYFYADRGDGSWDYNCDSVQSKNDTRTTLYICDTYFNFPADYGCNWTNGWENTAPDCGETENWGSSCYYFPLAFCEPDTYTPVDQECR